VWTRLCLRNHSKHSTVAAKTIGAVWSSPPITNSMLETEYHYARQRLESASWASRASRQAAMTTRLHSVVERRDDRSCAVTNLGFCFYRDRR
jgi:hypothetical protein